MSAYVVNDSTINRIVTHLDCSRKDRWVKNELADLGFELGQRTIANQNEARDDLKRLADALFQLNVDAVNYRYDGGAEQFRPLDFQYQVELAGYWTALAELETFLYQCSEGDIPTRPLFIIMQELKYSLWGCIVHDLPAYKAAEARI